MSNSIGGLLKPPLSQFLRCFYTISTPFSSPHLLLSLSISSKSLPSSVYTSSNPLSTLSFTPLYLHNDNQPPTSPPFRQLSSGRASTSPPSNQPYSRHFSTSPPSNQQSAGHVSTSPPFKNLAVLGSGQMGTGIALTIAHQLGLKQMDPKTHKVYILDKNSEQLSKSQKFVADWAHKQVSKGKLTTDQSLALSSHLHFQTLEGLTHLSFEFCIEAVTEDLHIKQQAFKSIEECIHQDTVLATNTSSIPITRIASKLKYPECVIGLHFMNPVPVMPLVEVIKGLQTHTPTVQKAIELVEFIEKTHTHSLDRPGFIANRILMPYINEAIYVLQEGIGTCYDIDQTLKLGTHIPMGPLTLADFIGLDTCLYIMKILHTELGDSKYRPAPLLTQYVDAGWLGKKTGRGFYSYN